jgi:hypothetical protein
MQNQILSHELCFIYLDNHVKSDRFLKGYQKVLKNVKKALMMI